MLHVQDIDKIEHNTHLILYYLHKKYPEWATTREIVDVTRLHLNTIYNKTKTLSQMKAVESKKIGRSIGYFITDDYKTIFDKWLQTDRGKSTANMFDRMLKDNLDTVK